MGPQRAAAQSWALAPAASAACTISVQIQASFRAIGCASCRVRLAHLSPEDQAAEFRCGIAKLVSKTCHCHVQSSHHKQCHQHSTFGVFCLLCRLCHAMNPRPPATKAAMPPTTPPVYQLLHAKHASATLSDSAAADHPAALWNACHIKFARELDQCMERWTSASCSNVRPRDVSSQEPTFSPGSAVVACRSSKPHLCPDPTALLTYNGADMTGSWARWKGCQRQCAAKIEALTL